MFQEEPQCWSSNDLLRNRFQILSKVLQTIEMVIRLVKTCYIKHFSPVILSGRSDFEGFMLQARDAANPGPTNILGGFTLANSSWTQLLTCYNTKVNMHTF